MIRLSYPLQKLRQEGVLTMLDLRLGSLLDQGNYGNNFSYFGTPAWMRMNRRGVGAFCKAVPSDYFSPGNPVSLQTTEATLIFAGSRFQSRGLANYQGLLTRINGFGLFFNSVAEPKVFGVYDWNTGLFRPSTVSQSNDGMPHFYAASFRSGVANGTQMYCDGAPCGTALVTLVDQLNVWQVGNGAAAGQGYGGIAYLGAIVTKYLSLAEIAEIYRYWLLENVNPHIPRRIRYQYPQMTNAQYTAKGIVLDSKGERISTTQIADETNNYPGTQTGAPITGAEDVYGPGLTYSSTDWVNRGDVTQLNAVAAFSIEMVVSFPPGNIINSYMLAKFQNANNNIFIGVTTGGAISPKKLVVSVCNGGVSSVATDLQVMRGGATHHIIVTFNAGTIIIYVDGEVYSSTATGVIPALTANLAGVGLYEGVNGGPTTPYTSKCLRIVNRVMTPTESTQAYLEWARRIDWQISGESTPVSLVASVAAGKYIDNWYLVSGSHRISEDSLGKRWLQCVTAGAATSVKPVLCGSTVFTFTKATAGTAIYVVFEGSANLGVSAGQTGYVFASDAGERVGIYRYPGFAAMFYSNTGYIAAGVAYDVAINRRWSNGSFTAWIRGGAFSSWTLISTVGGSGSNPSAAEATYFASKFMGVTLNAGDRILNYNPSGNLPHQPRHPLHYAGQLIPTAGEVL